MKTIGITILALFGTIATYFVVGYVGVALGIFALPLFRLQTKVDTNYQIIQKTYNADNVIYNYEWFKQTYEDIQADDLKIANAQKSLDIYKENAGEQKNWTFEDKTEIARLGAVILGLQNHKEDLVATYNARAKMANRNIFQNNLPMFISL